MSSGDEYRVLARLAGKGPAPHQFREEIRGIAADAQGRIWVVGDSAVKAFDAGGALVREWETSRPGHGVAVDAEGNVWVGQWQQVEVFDAAGRRARTRTDPGRLGLVTAIALGDDDVFLGDATARWIRRYDRQGAWVNDIGDRHRKGGFHIPNGVVDFALDGGGVLHVANPGMHRVERYRADGEYLGHFGRFDGVDPAGFPGCCNPTNLALDARGRVVVSEKAPPRIKLYAPEGQLLAVVADRGFSPEAKNMDLVVDASDRILVADTASLEIVVLAPVASGAAA